VRAKPTGLGQSNGDVGYDPGWNARRSIADGGGQEISACRTARDRKAISQREKQSEHSLERLTVAARHSRDYGGVSMFLSLRTCREDGPSRWEHRTERWPSRFPTFHSTVQTHSIVGKGTGNLQKRPASLLEFCRNALDDLGRFRKTKSLGQSMTLPQIAFLMTQDNRSNASCSPERMAASSWRRAAACGSDFEAHTFRVLQIGNDLKQIVSGWIPVRAQTFGEESLRESWYARPAWESQLLH